MGYRGGDDLEGAVDLLVGGEAGEREAQAGAGFGWGEAHGNQDVRGLGGAGLAGRAEAGGDALEIERDEQGLSIDAVEADIGGVGGAVGGGAVDVGVGDGGEEAGFEAVAEGGELGWGVGCEPVEGEFGGSPEGDGAGDVLGAGAMLMLLRATVEQRSEMDSVADEEDAGALGGVHLVAGDGEEVDVFERSGEVDGELGGGLNGVGVEEDGGVVGLGDAGEFADGLDGAGLVVGEHDGDQFGVGPEGGLEGFGVDDAVAPGSEVGDGGAAAVEGLRGVEDRVVLDLGGEEMSRLALVEEGLEDAGEGEVVALGAAGVEDDLFGRAVEQTRDGGAGVLDGGAGALAGVVRGAGIAEGLAPERTHRFNDFREDRGGGVVVEIDAVHPMILVLWRRAALWTARTMPHSCAMIGAGMGHERLRQDGEG